MMHTHQPGQAVFRSILPEDIDWKPFPAFPPQARLAVVVGEPAGPGPYVIRVKVPPEVMLMPHRHPEDRVYTVISGVFYIGLGEQFDSEKLEAYPPGSVVVLPGGTPALSLGQIRRVCHSGDGDRAAWPGIRDPGRRPKKPAVREPVMIITGIQAIPRASLRSCTKSRRTLHVFGRGGPNPDVIRAYLRT